MNEELNEHLEALRQWIQRQSNTARADAGISAEERKQLQAINKTILQLTRLNVTVPEDLRNLKLRLSAKDASIKSNNEVEEQVIEIGALIDQLRKLLQAARSLRDGLKATGQVPGTKKHYGVALLDLLRNGDLSSEDKLELQWLQNGPVFEGEVRPDGSVMAKLPNGWKQYRSLSTAATEIAERSLNGWEHWRRINSDGSRTPLKEIRKRYMNEGANQ